MQTNLLGSLLCTRAAMAVMARQPGGGHVFNIDGAGADGLPTPNYAAYGATKAGAGARPFSGSEVLGTEKVLSKFPQFYSCPKICSARRGQARADCSRPERDSFWPDRGSFLPACKGALAASLVMLTGGRKRWAARSRSVCRSTAMAWDCALRQACG